MRFIFFTAGTTLPFDPVIRLLVFIKSKYEQNMNFNILQRQDRGAPNSRLADLKKEAY